MRRLIIVGAKWGPRFECLCEVTRATIDGRLYVKILKKWNDDYDIKGLRGRGGSQHVIPIRVVVHNATEEMFDRLIMAETYYMTDAARLAAEYDTEVEIVTRNAENTFHNGIIKLEEKFTKQVNQITG